jgi:preprotein translocase subunit Sec63
MVLSLRFLCAVLLFLCSLYCIHARLVSPKLKNYYSILGAEEDDDVTVIKAKIRQLSLKHHPDRQRTAAAKAENSEKMLEINEAVAAVMAHVLLCGCDQS